MKSQVAIVGRRAVVSGVGGLVLSTGPGKAAVPPGLEGRRVRVQLDDEVLQTIPGDERVDLAITEDHSPSARALISATPPGRAIPVIYVVVGVLSVPVIWDAIREMLRRNNYGGVLVDARQTPALISHDKSLPADAVWFIAPDGHISRYLSHNIPEDLLLQIAKVR